MKFTSDCTVRKALSCAAVLALWASWVPLAAADGLTQVEQRIFGMDCAPCAYGIEQGIKKLSGVTSVRVSLNEGAATVALAPNSTTTLESIRKVIRENGFTPKTARVTIIGKLVQADQATWLDVPGLPRYRVSGASDQVQASLQARAGGAPIELKGEIPESPNIATELKVLSIGG